MSNPVFSKAKHELDGRTGVDMSGQFGAEIVDDLDRVAYSLDSYLGNQMSVIEDAEDPEMKQEAAKQIADTMNYLRELCVTWSAAAKLYGNWAENKLES